MAASLRGSHGSKRPLQPQSKRIPIKLRHYMRQAKINSREPTHFGTEEASSDPYGPRGLSATSPQGWPRRGVLPSLRARGRESRKWQEGRVTRLDATGDGTREQRQRQLRGKEARKFEDVWLKSSREVIEIPGVFPLILAGLGHEMGCAGMREWAGGRELFREKLA
ncbi:hypothetical protein CRG98_044338 [Punica granatum]|uniref:Uncharacterized protein n=1 Tax=Punica granatum TaxID=22663 RepID=A0A2I0HU92_PUNGR|nr:hypothetical protein CRG98_044338 [Punica granatum]